MTIVNKSFDELTSHELYELLRVRAEVFVVEQSCIYQDLDRIDYDSRHVLLYDEDEIVAYLRVFSDGDGIARIGRVLTTRRGCGFGLTCMKEGIRSAIEDLSADSVLIDAQVYAIDFYKRLGFRVTSNEFLEDGIPHVKMELDLN